MLAWGIMGDELGYKGYLIGAIVQARNGSSRFPRKVFADLAGRPILGRIIERLRGARLPDKIVIATTREPEDREIIDFARSAGVFAFAGSTNDVQERFLGAAHENGLQVIVRICGDSPFVDPEMIDRLVRELIDGGGEYAEPDPATPAAYEGMEAMTLAALERSRTMGDEGPDREHVTRFMRCHPDLFRLVHPKPAEEVQGKFRLSVDNFADLEFARAVYAALYREGEIFSAAQLANFLKTHPEVAALNSHVKQKKTDAKDLHVAFYVAYPEQIEQALPLARCLNEEHHCGIGFMGQFGESDADRIRSMGYRAAIIPETGAVNLIGTTARDWRVSVILVGKGEDRLIAGLTAQGIRTAFFDDPLEKILPAL